MKQKVLGGIPIYFKGYEWKIDVNKNIWHELEIALADYYKNNQNDFSKMCESLFGFNYEQKDLGEDHFDFDVDGMVFTVYKDLETGRVWLSKGIFIDAEEDWADVWVNLVD